MEYKLKRYSARKNTKMMEMGRREFIGNAILVGGAMALAPKLTLPVFPEQDGWARVRELRQANEWEAANQVVHRIWEREAHERKHK